MILGSLLDLGVKESKIGDVLAPFGLALKVQAVRKGGIAAKKVELTRTAPAEGSEVQSYRAIVRRIERSGLRNEFIQHSLRIFDRLARAEAVVHGVAKEDVQFHELGALDTIGDIVGSVAAILDLHPDLILSTPISVGSGYTEAEHGLLPVPAPATVEILRHSTLIYRGGPFDSASELLTPTGAAILAHFVQRSEPFLPQMRIEHCGYGAGSRDLPLPNVVRVSFGELGDLLRDEVEVLETNVDNVTGEVLGELIEVLMAEGAKDVAIVPMLMKKGRPGYLVKVMTASQDAARLAYRIMEETGSLGVRVMHVKHRYIAAREEKRVKVRIKGLEREVNVKVGKDARGNVLNVAAEFEDVKRLARELKMPVKEVTKVVEGDARKKVFDEEGK